METSVPLHDLIYDLVCGNLDLTKIFIPESQIVVNEFSEGSLCMEWYHQMLAAYSRLCARLGVEEWNDSDVEDIIHLLMNIERHIALKMFNYGVYFGSLGLSSNT